MSATNSTMLELGTSAPSFSLPDVATGKRVSLGDFQGQKALLVIFLCAHCPYVHHIVPELARIGRDYEGRGVALVAITSNDVAQYPDDAPESTACFAQESGFNFPVLYDETQSVAQEFTAACTPDLFLFGPARTLVYRGQIDGSRPSRGGSSNPQPLDGRDLRAALDAVLADRPVDPVQKASIGCNIKWKPGGEPAYYGH